MASRFAAEDNYCECTYDAEFIISRRSEVHNTTLRLVHASAHCAVILIKHFINYISNSIMCVNYSAFAC